MASLRRVLSSSSRGSKYALGANFVDKGLLLCNIRSGEISSVDFPIPIRECDYVRFLSTCKGLALVNANYGGRNALIIGNPVAAKWKTIQVPSHGTPPGLGLPWRPCFTAAGLGRHSLDNSVRLIGCLRHEGKCWTYDFHGDSWIPGPDHGESWDLESNVAWHRDSFYAFHSQPLDPLTGEGDDWESYSGSRCTDESKMEECESVGLFRCHFGDHGNRSWSRVELRSPVMKRLLGGWSGGGRRLISYKNRLLLYLWNAIPYKTDPSPSPRRQAQRMFELLDNEGNVVEDESWIEAADKLDPDGDWVPFKSWCDVVYGDDGEDFFWHDSVKKKTMLHSGVDGSVVEIDAPGGREHRMRIQDITGFEDYSESEYDVFL